MLTDIIRVANSQAKIKIRHEFFFYLPKQKKNWKSIILPLQKSDNLGISQNPHSRSEVQRYYFLNSLSRISKCNIIQLSIFILKQNMSVPHDFIKISLYQFLCEFSLLQWLFKYSISVLGLQKAIRFPVKFSLYKTENIWSLLFIFSFSGQHPSLYKSPVIGFLLLTWQIVCEPWTAPTS